jgi:L-asparaginase
MRSSDAVGPEGAWMTLPPRIAILATGGTIACAMDGQGNLVRTHSAADLLGMLPPISGLDVQPSDHDQVSSWNMTPPAMLQLARRIDHLLLSCDSVVVTHGTDTLEETAAFLSFALRSSAPVIVTGAMRASDELGADGARNLSSALLVAADPDARGRGTLVVFDDQVHRGVAVTKRHSSAAAAFCSLNSGPIGHVHDGAVAFAEPPVAPTRYEVEHADADVPLLLAAPGAPVRIVEAALAGADGLVVAGCGLGHLPSTWMGPLGEAVRSGIAVVMTTRTYAGPVYGRYAGPGGDVDARERGLIAAGYRTPQAARIQLICALGAGQDPTAAFASLRP